MTQLATTPLAGPEKAALVILGLDEHAATEVLRQLSEAELRLLAASVDRVPFVSQAVLEATFAEFEHFMEQPFVPAGKGQYVRKLMATTFGPDRMNAVLGPQKELPPSVQRIRDTPPAALSDLLLAEHPQVAAVVLTRLEQASAAEVLRRLPAEMQIDLLARMATLGEIPARAIEAATDVIARSIESADAQVAEGHDTDLEGLAFVAGLLNELTTPDAETLLGRLSGARPELAPRIRDAMLRFEDLADLGNRDLQLLLREISRDDLLIALRTAAEHVRERVFATVSPRVATQLREDLSHTQPRRMTDIDAAQSRILQRARALATAGRIRLTTGKGDAWV